MDTRPGFDSAVLGDDVGAFADFEARTYTLTGFCDVPDGATALSINLAIVPGPNSGFATVGPTGGGTATCTATSGPGVFSATGCP